MGTFSSLICLMGCGVKSPNGRIWGVTKSWGAHGDKHLLTPVCHNWEPQGGWVTVIPRLPLPLPPADPGLSLAQNQLIKQQFEMKETPSLWIKRIFSEDLF